MSNNLKLISIILFSLSLCLLTGCSGEILKSREEMVDDAAMTILKALENGDVEAIKELFSKEALEQVENIDDEIQVAMDFFEGSVPEGSIDDISVPDHYPAYIEDKTIRHGTTVTLNTGLYNIETDKTRYSMQIEMYSRSDENPDMEGVVTIEIVPYGKRRSKDFKWQAYSGNGDAGVFIQEADTEPVTEEETKDEEQDSYYEENIKISNQVLYDGYKWFGSEKFGYMQIPKDCEEFTEMTNENRPNMITMRNAAQTVIISVDYFDEVTSDEDAKNMADQIAENAVQMGADSLYEHEDIRLDDHMKYYERYETLDKTTETTAEYYLYYYVAYIPKLNRGVYISVEGVYEDVMKAMGMIKMTYTATK